MIDSYVHPLIYCVTGPLWHWDGQAECAEHSKKSTKEIRRNVLWNMGVRQKPCGTGQGCTKVDLDGWPASPPFKAVNFGPQNFQSSSAPKFYKNSKLDAYTKAAEFLIGTVLKVLLSSIDLARSQALTRDFDFLLILVFFNDCLCFFIVF